MQVKFLFICIILLKIFLQVNLDMKDHFLTCSRISWSNSANSMGRTLNIA